MAGLFDYEFQLEKINAHNPPLQKLDAVIDWEIFREPIEQALHPKGTSYGAHVTPKAPGGRPPFDRLMKFKIIILQRYYNLGDEQTKFLTRRQYGYSKNSSKNSSKNISSQTSSTHFLQHN